MLENIVQSLVARPNSINREIEAQYEAQMDVILQLGSKVVQQVQAGKAQAEDTNVWVKLERDLDTIQCRVGALKESAQAVRARRMDLAQEQASIEPSSAQDGSQDFEFQQQMQLQQDVSLKPNVNFVTVYSLILLIHLRNHRE